MSPKMVALCVALLSILFGPPLVAGSQKGLYMRTAVEPQKKSEQAVSSDEIDREIEKYFDQVRNSRTIDVDDQRLNELFRKQAPESVRTTQTSDSATFHNRNVGEREKKAASPEDAKNGIASHTVKAGDTIYGIAKTYGVEAALILRHNPMLSKRPMYIGEEILVTQVESKNPIRRTSVVYHRVRKGETLSRLSRKYKASVATLQKWNRLKTGSINVGQRLKVGTRALVSIPRGYKERAMFQMPSEGGRITSGFGRRRNPFDGGFSSFHKGVDIGLDLGTRFRAAREGVVIFAQRMGGYGNCIFIRHSDGFVSVYAHGKKIMVRRGDVVQRGQLIGYVGRTGNATGPHLHFEIRRWKRAMNPIAALRMRELVPASANQIRKAALR